MNEECALPVSFKSQHIRKIFQSFSDCGVKVTRLIFTESDDEADVLFAEEIDFDDLDGRECSRCHIYFSTRCDGHMAATAYFLAVSNFSGLMRYSNESLYKFCSLMFQRFGKSLTPTDEKQFWNEKLDFLRRQSIQCMDATRKEEIERRFQSQLWSYQDCYFCPESKSVNLLYRFGDELGLFKIFW
jgi:hypothetical protein